MLETILIFLKIQPKKDSSIIVKFGQKFEDENEEKKCYVIKLDYLKPRPFFWSYNALLPTRAKISLKRGLEYNYFL